ncbi:hypothetical protein [Dickeya solani]|uniref:hypothetical protein n=1 Tax=Dickeya solani TaxID=1089444 RepID=UPI000A43EFED|nr:hypothetical protein [Dickeya solani]
MRQQLKQQFCQAQEKIPTKRTFAGFSDLCYLFSLIIPMFIIGKYRDKTLRKSINTQIILLVIFVINGLL